MGDPVGCEQFVFQTTGEYTTIKFKHPVNMQKSVFVTDNKKFSSGDACHLGPSPKDKDLSTCPDPQCDLEIPSRIGIEFVDDSLYPLPTKKLPFLQ